MQLCTEITVRGGKAEDPLAYKAQYNDLLNEHIKNRIQALKSREVDPELMMVPGALAWLRTLVKRGVQCFLASGTDEKYVQEEVDLLGLTPYFSAIYGAIDDLSKYSKKMVIDRIISVHQLAGPEFVVFGDGFIEIEDSKAAGGIAVGVASNEKTCQGVDEWKRNRLIAAGADLIIPDFRCASTLETYLFNPE